MNYWITTHWPVPESIRRFLWHVYVKRTWHLRRLPEIGDIVLVYETKTSPTCWARLCRGHRRTGELFDVRKGVGGIIGKMTVCGTKRDLCADDVLLDYGDLCDDEGFPWEIIPCDRWCRCDDPLLRSDLMKALGKRPDIPPRFLFLWPVPGGSVQGLLHRIGCNGCVGRA